MFAWYHRRWIDLVTAIYIYNEHRGYTALDRVLAAVRMRSPGDAAFIADMVVRLAARDAGFVSGATWDINGGLFMR